MNSSDSSPSALWTALSRLASIVVRGVLGLVALALMVGLMLLGLMIGATLVVWALLKGRRPVGVQFGMPRGARWRDFRAAAAQRQAAQHEVVDVEAREIVVADAQRRWPSSMADRT